MKWFFAAGGGTRGHAPAEPLNRPPLIPPLNRCCVNLAARASIDGPPGDGQHFTIMPAEDHLTDERLAYLRLHGRDAKAYLTGTTVATRLRDDYSEAEMPR